MSPVCIFSRLLYGNPQGQLPMRPYIVFFALLLGAILSAQKAKDKTSPETEKQEAKDLRASKQLTFEGNKSLEENQFITSEAYYRRAISKSAKNADAPYNLGNAYYNNNKTSEAFGRYKDAAETSDNKEVKHKALHNLGNVLMKRKEYEKAVEAYKASLRNDPTDEETRYNLALAQEMLKKQQDQQQNDQNKDDQQNQDQNKDDQQNQDQQNDGQNKDNKDKGDQDKKDNGDQDKKDQGDQGEDDQDQGDPNDQQKNQEGQEDDQKQEGQQPPPRPNQLSKQQVQNLLDAMQNEEKKVQEKIDAQKVQGVKVRNEKDW